MLYIKFLFKKYKKEKFLFWFIANCFPSKKQVLAQLQEMGISAYGSFFTVSTNVCSIGVQPFSHN